MIIDFIEDIKGLTTFTDVEISPLMVDHTEFPAVSYFTRDGYPEIYYDNEVGLTSTGVVLNIFSDRDWET